MYKAVLFDFDGVIADSEPLHYIAEKTLIETHGKAFRDEAFNQTLGRSMRDAFELYKTFFGINAPTEALLEEHDKIFIKLVEEELKPVPGALELIERVEKSDYHFAIASSGNHAYIKKALKKFGVDDKFGDRITSIEMVTKGKPEPDLFLHAASKLMIPPQYCVVIEDSTSGIKAAHKAGMRSLFLNQINKFNETDYNAVRIQSLNDVTSELFSKL